MRKNLLPKIIVGMVLVLLALHFLVSNVSVTREGSWRDPKFSFSFSGDDKAASSNGEGDAPSGDKSHSSWTEWRPWKTTPHASEEPEDLDLPDVNPPQTTPSDASTSTTEHFDSATTSHAQHSTEQHHTAEQSHHQSATPTHTSSSAASTHHSDADVLPCYHLEGAEDVVFVIKTGATEVDEKIPVHYNTSLRCFPNYLLFSDFGEEFQGHTIHDAIGNVIDQIRLGNDDFDLWRRLHEKGRASLDDSELSINDHGDPTGGGGNPDNGGWRLDKFKNIPMVNYTIHKYPDAKWFIYTDADTYIVWSNLLKWVKQMDPNRLLYLGSPAMIDDQVFGHGGSGYVISNALMKKAADVYNERQAEWDIYAADHWAGDCVLATLLEKLGAPLTWAYPIIQGGDPVVMDFWETGYNRRLWCYPAVSYHHIKPSTVASLWHLEQEWLANNTDKDLHHGDVYKQWMLPQLSSEREGWDNLSEDEMTEYEINDAWGCRDHCQANTTCMQWTWKDNLCKTYDKTKFGKESEGMQAGWIVDRIHEHLAELDKCDEGEWILPDEEKEKEKRSSVSRHELALQVLQKYR